jgi:hypothetical protein
LYYFCSDVTPVDWRHAVADLEQRVTTLEREVSVLKERVGADEEDVRNIPDLIKMEFRWRTARSPRCRATCGAAAGSRRLDRQGRRLRGAMPRVMAELVSEMLADRDRKR